MLILILDTKCRIACLRPLCSRSRPTAAARRSTSSTSPRDSRPAKENRCQFHQHFMSSFCVHLQFGFVIIRQNNIGAKSACKMLVKLTTGVIHFTGNPFKNLDRFLFGIFFFLIVTKQSSFLDCSSNVC